MNKLFICDETIYIEKDNSIINFNYVKLEDDMEDILDIIDNKVIIIFNFTISDYKYYIDIFKAYKIKIINATNIQNIYRKMNLNIYIISNTKSLYINKRKYEIKDFGLNDNYSFEGLDYLIINESMIIDIFKNYDKYKPKTIQKSNINEYAFIIIIIFIFLIIAYLIDNIYKFDKIKNEIEVYKIKNSELEDKAKHLSDTLGNIENKIEILDSKTDFIDNLSKKNYKPLIDKVYKYNELDIYIIELKYENKKLYLKGNAKDYNKFISTFNDANIISLRNINDNIEFVIQMEYEWENILSI